jgi:molybdopterin converting factor small subunit
MQVQLFATLREGRGKEVDIPWQDGMDGHAVLRELGLKPCDVKIFLVNGIHSKPDAMLKDGDILALFPSTGGG